MTDQAGGDGRARPTKAEKKEQARLEREQIQRRMAARKRNRNLGFAAIALAIAAIVVAIVVVQPGGETASAFPTPQELLDQAPAAAASAGCDEVQTIGPYGDVADPNSGDYTDQAHIGDDDRFPEMPALSTYPSIPPTSGPHAAIPPGPMPAGVYDEAPDLARVIHSLEHGASVIWYDPSASGAELDQLRGFYDQMLDDTASDRVIVAPYDYPGEGGQLPDGVIMSLTAWHRMQTCTQVSLPVAYDFSSQFSALPAEGRDYAGDAPEAGADL